MRKGTQMTQSQYELRRAGIADRLREMRAGQYASVTHAIAEEDVRESDARNFALACWREDVVFYGELASTADTQELRDLCAWWRDEMKRRVEAV